MRSITVLTLLACVVRAQVTEAVTDLSIFKLLAPCASRAVSAEVWNLRDSTQLGCGTSSSELQSCICSQSDVSSSVASNISSVVKSRCGTSASSDQWSASKVLRQYCNSGETITFETPTTNIVTDYMTDVDKMDYLAPCAYSALSQAAMYSPSAHCPDSASTLYNSCICNKGDVVSMINWEMSRRIAGSCSNREDVELAAEFYSEYCAMNNGTTSFVQIPTPPGDMTYHITGLSQFSSLKECGKSAMSTVILQQTTRLCPSGPQALASCICIKEGMSNNVYNDMTAQVKYECGFEDEDTVKSAVDVFEYYCSAAEDKVTAKVSDTARQKYPTAVEAEDSSSGRARETDGGNGGDSKEADNEAGSGGPSAGVIAGAVVGSVVGVALIAGGVFWLIRHRRRHTSAAKAATTGPNGDANPGVGELEDRSNLASPKYEMSTSTPQVAGSELSGVTTSTPTSAFGAAELPSDRFQQPTTRYELGG